MATESDTKNEQLFRHLEDYPWDADDEFQSGLSAILGPKPAPEQAEYLTLRARCFYYSRKHNITIDFPAYQSWHAQHTQSTPANGLTSLPVEQATPNKTEESSASGETNPPYPMSFNHIVELITTGQPIPGIKEIPSTVLEGQASESVGTRRKKPWEAEAGGSKDVQLGSISS